MCVPPLLPLPPPILPARPFPSKSRHISTSGSAHVPVFFGGGSRPLTALCKVDDFAPFVEPKLSSSLFLCPSTATISSHHGLHLLEGGPRSSCPHTCSLTRGPFSPVPRPRRQRWFWVDLSQRFPVSCPGYIVTLQKWSRCERERVAAEILPERRVYEQGYPQALIFGGVVKPSNSGENDEKVLGMLPRNLGHRAEPLECVIEAFSPGAAPRLKAYESLPYSISRALGCTFLCLSPNDQAASPSEKSERSVLNNMQNSEKSRNL